MATNTYVALDRQKLTSASSSVTFTSISQSYTDLRIVVQAGNASGISAVGVRYNSDSGSNYSWTRMYGDGSSVTSNRSSDTAAYFGIIGTSIAQTFTVDIMNYSNTTTYKTAISRSSDAANYVATYVNLWRGSTGSATNQPITTLTFINSNGGNFPIDSTFTLYGIAADTNAFTAKATGGTITADVGYIYHTFTSSGTFTPSIALSCDYLVVAGGGAGGAGSGGAGGGAGGYRYFSSQSLSATGYTVTIGAGGSSTTQSLPTPQSGNNSVFGSDTATGGGGGGSEGASYRNGFNGGSGGGSGYNGTAGSASPAGQGNNGGTDGTPTNYSGGGGGGAGAVGANAGGTSAGNGGIGLNTLSDWATTTSTGASGYYAGGGGGGSQDGNNPGTPGNGGLGGGGKGGQYAAGPSNWLPGIAGTANTGGGGGGGAFGPSNAAPAAGGAGGSGIVIVRYAK